MDEHLDISNLPKLCHEALILSILQSGPRHGYQLALDVAERSAGRFVFQHGTLYPILHRLEAAGLISGVWSKEPGRRRKLYELTESGYARALELRHAWRDFTRHLLAVLRGSTP